MKENILLTSLSRIKKSAPWRVGIYKNGTNTFFHVGSNGNVAMSPRFIEFVSKIEAQVKRYPVDINFQHLADGRDMEATTLKERIVYVDCGFSSAQLVKGGRYYYNEKIMNSPLEVEMNVRPAAGLFSSRAVTGNIPSTSFDYIIVAKVDEVVDGDTIHVTVEETTDFLSSEFEIEEGDSLEIRYNGIDCPEKYVASETAYKDPKNQRYADIYGVTLDDMYSVGAEAHEYNKEILRVSKDLPHPFVILHLDRYAEGGSLNIDTYGRHVADVYVPTDKMAVAIVEKIHRGDSFTHVNKMILTQQSKKIPAVPLATFELDDALEYNTTILNPTSWVKELGLKVFDPGDDNKQGMIDPDRLDVPEEDPNPAEKMYDKYIDAEDIIIGEESKPSDNRLDFFEPYDDRLDEFTKGINNVNDLKNHTRVRIGDSILTIPPTDIELIQTSKIHKVKTLRTKSSVKVNRGQSLKTLRLSLYFHDQEAINGTPYPWKKTEGDETGYFYVDGLRPLLAQFAKCPFVPIQSYYINSVLGIRNVGLLNLEVTTVPNFPESIQAVLTLVEFNPSVFLMDTSDLEEVINYPLMRWYYNEAMIDRGSNYRYFKGLENPLTDNLTFSIANESSLNVYKQAVDALMRTDSPETMRIKMRTENVSYAAKLKDSKRTATIVDQHTAYKAMNLEKYSVIDYISEESRSELEFLLKAEKFNEDQVKKSMNQATELFGDIYMGEYKNLGNHIARQKDLFLPYEGRVFYGPRFGLDTNDFTGSAWVSPPVDYSTDLYQGREKDGLIVIGFMEDPDNQALMEKHFGGWNNDEQKVFRIPAYQGAVDILKTIVDSPKDMMDTIDELEDEYNQYLTIIHQGEAGVSLNEYEVEGDFTVLSMTAQFSNEFSTMPIRSVESPGLQYLGGGDPSISFVLDADEEAVGSISRLIGLSNEYARKYHYGITSGFIGITNDLAQLFGITHIMFENIQIRNINGFPGRYEISFDCINFDKTQRQREELVALPGNTKDMDLGMLEQNKIAFANDRMIESRLHYLEVYPDLELPTYEKLNSILPLIDTGGCKEYKNSTGGTYVDPDFYFSTKNTLRRYFEDEYSGEHSITLYDQAGIAVVSSNKDVDSLFRVTDEDAEKFKELEKTDGVEPLGWSSFKWGDSEESSSDGSEENMVSGEMVEDYGNGSTGIQNEELRTFLEKMNGDVPAYNSFPTEEEWKAIFPDDSYGSYMIHITNPNPSEELMYTELNKLVDTYFSDYYSIPGFIKDCKGDLSEAADQGKVAAYTPPDDFYGFVYEYNMDKKLTKEQKTKVKELNESDKGWAEAKSDTDMINRTWSNLKYKIPKERFMTLFKAFLSKTTGWKHFINGSPTVSRTNRVGLCQISIESKDMSVSEAKRLMYNWKYNLETAVIQLALNYKKLTKLNEDCENFEITCRPWDAMFALYENPTGYFYNTKSLEDSPLYQGVTSMFKNFALKPFNTGSGFNSWVYKTYAGLNEEEHALFGGETEDFYASSLVELQYIDKKVLKEHKLTIESDVEDINRAMKKHLLSLDRSTLAELYIKHTKKLHGLYESNYNSLTNTIPKTILEKEGEGIYIGPGSWRYTRETVTKGKEIYDAFKDVEASIKEGTVDTDLRLYNDVDPHVLYEEMFYDLRYHDQRGRMLRAFPGFQMFIVHEGKWFGKYKFWDNMYGFNAISSMDIHRSRKIAADTAIISMTNVYANLTTRRVDIDYTDRQMKFWDNLIFNKVPQDLIDKKENEILDNMFLETGARIHLRVGYGATASALPIVFNGTITELELGDEIQIVAQGDGIELGNTISGDPDDDNDHLFYVEEPRDLICGLMSSKGSWFKDVMNDVTDGTLFEKNPLGIMHFGVPFDTEDSTSSKPQGNIMWYNDEYGEVAQNIYSSNGSPTFSQWIHPNGERNNILSDMTWKNLWENKFKIFNPGDEKNVVVKFYNNTVWDIIQIIAYTSPDYIAAVMPFELRSTLFFGKPYWRASYQYSSRYQWDVAEKGWTRHIQTEARRPYMQHKFYTSSFDIIENSIRASEDGLFTNVVVNYDGNQTPILYADADIRYDKQKTRVVEADIVAKLGDFYTSEVVASHYGMSVLRDNMKDMYKGYITVIGDPTVKPHDMMYIGDEIDHIQGNCLVKAVTHHFSAETGFTTQIEPDLLAVNDDLVMMEIAKWNQSIFQKTAVTLVARHAGNLLLSKTLGWMTRSGTIPRSINEWMFTRSLKQGFNIIDDGTPRMQGIQQTLKSIIQMSEADVVDTATLRNEYKLLSELIDKANVPVITSTGKGAAIKDLTKRAFLSSATVLTKAMGNMEDIIQLGKKLTGVGKIFTSLTPIGFLINVGIFIGVEMLFEKYRRFKENLQTVLVSPISYRGRPLTAGINGHAGMVVGDDPGKLDKLFNAQFGTDDEEIEEITGNFLIELANLFTGSSTDLEKQEKLKELGGTE